LQDRAAGVGFDWPDTSGPADKVREELDEAMQALEQSPARLSSGGAPIQDESHERVESELGDLLFACVNLCRKAGVHASLALDKANSKFERRFAGMEALASLRGLDLHTLGLEKLDELWDEVKRQRADGR
jgi:uncharacterized protein YabN with tetrapyrrole methylase and pyrophosphatase domain